MITIEQDKCNRCGLCVRICHEYCIRIENDLLKIDSGSCSACSQCIAICPKEALLWNNTRPEPYRKSLLPEPDQLDELLKERRTIRDFKPDRIDRDLLLEVVNYAIYSPAHNFDFRVIIIDDDKAIQQIDHTIYRYSLSLYRYLYKPKFMHAIVRFFTPDREYEYLKARPKLEAALKRGRSFRSVPPVIVMIIADKRMPLTLESAQYALYSINLSAHIRGLGCRNLVGNQMFLNRAGSVRNMLGLGKHEKIVGTMAMGYPAVKFRNKVEGRHIVMEWIHAGSRA